MKRILFLLAVLALSSYAAMQPATQEVIAKLPVIRVGDPVRGEFAIVT